MREEEFREWLGQRRWKGEPLSQKARDNRFRRSARAERGLRGLGFEQETLEELLAAGLWEAFLQKLSQLKLPGADPEIVRSVVPQATDPRGQLTNMISALRQYGYFLEGRDPNYDTDADGEEPALYIVTNLYGQSDAFDRFVERGQWTLLDDRGSELNELVRAMQPGDAIAMRDWLPRPRDLPFDARGNIVTGMRFRAVGRVTRNHGDGIGVDVDWTVLPEPRTWYFYTRNRAVWQPPMDNPMAQELRDFLLEGQPQDYDRFIERWWGEATKLPINRAALDAMRAMFLSGNPGFTTFAASRSLEGGEGRGKRDLIAKVHSLIEANDLTDEGLGGALLDLLADKSEGALLHWRMVDGLAKYRAASPGTLERAVAEMVRSDAPVPAVENFARETWPIISAGQEASLPYQDSRAIPTAIGALVWPDRIIALSYTQFHNAGVMLLGRSLFANAPLSGDELRETVALAQTLFTIMRDEWGWEPRDYWDVRGFLWETCQKRLDLPAREFSRTTGVEERTMTQPKNLILYGPPGTGKTFATAHEAVTLCDGIAPSDRTELMVRYEDLRKEGRIGFVTFHQSFSYEDFVEGLRPETGGEADDGGSGFSLQPQDGIFKQMADLAGVSRGASLENAPSISRDRKVFKMSLGRAGAEDYIYQDALSGGYVVLGWGGDVDWSDQRFDNWDAIKERWRQDHPDAHGNDPNLSQMYTFRIAMRPGSLIVVSDGNRKFRAIGEVTGPYQFVPGPNGEYNHRRAVNWLWSTDQSLPRELIYEKVLSQVSAYQMNSAAIKWEGLQQIIGGGTDAGKAAPPQPHVLIIDEINRANISKVFGELITLIEPDKRLDMANALTVRLPYSKRDFGVPANLHLIGTMNTADRSIALLDTALRRRFRFKEIAPDPTVLPPSVAGIPLRRVLDTINQRIEYLIDREHRIGHAFFMGEDCATRAGIDAAMRDKVIPLLQEYFFEDWSRIHAVLGGGFIGRTMLKPPPGLEGLEEKPSWFVREPFRADAYDILVGKVAAPPEADAPDEPTGLGDEADVNPTGE